MFIEKLQQEISDWRSGGYSGIKPQTENILNYAKQISFLHDPQFEALETYVYLKEIKNNRPVAEVFKSLYKNEDELLLDGLGLAKSKAFDYKGKTRAINGLIEERFGKQDYASQLFALTMGAGKTLLMGAMMVYDFILSFYYPEDKRFAKNALIFAPDKTIIESLKEIKSFDWLKIFPREYEDTLLNIKYHYLEDTKTELALIGNYNIVVSNSQKIILKTQTKPVGGLLLDLKYQERQEIENRRLREIRRLKNLIVFVDEAHHAFGKTLEGNLKKVKQTINYLHKDGKTELTAMINLTGTPYINGKMIEETVYWFGLKQGIEQGILKQVEILNYGNVKTQEFVNNVLDVFFDKYSDKRLDSRLPKIAFYAPSIADLQNNLKPMIDKALAKQKKSNDIVLQYHTEAEESKEGFIKLDTAESDKQIILLVGKGTEGWNCKSLTATALFRKPKSSIFVLQSTTRCLRAVGDNSTKATIFLSEENYKVLDKELQNNFKIGIADIDSQESEQVEHILKVIKKKKLIAKRKIKNILAVKRKGLDKIKINTKSYKGVDIAFIQASGILLKDGEANYSQGQRRAIKFKGDFNYYEIMERLSRQTHLDYLEIKNILKRNNIEAGELIKKTNSDLEFMGFLIGEIISRSFDYQEEVREYSEEIELTKSYPFKISVDRKNNKLVIYRQDKSKRLGFNIDPYNFDSEDEKDLFFALSSEFEKDEAIKDIYFTGGITNALHNDFYFEYYSPENDRISKYFPDFLIETTKGRYLVIEVKGRDKQADYEANKKSYTGKRDSLFNEVFSKEVGFKEFGQLNKNFDYKIVFDARLQRQQEGLFEKIKQFA